jgi:hypothetical protein
MAPIGNKNERVEALLKRHFSTHQSVHAASQREHVAEGPGDSASTSGEIGRPNDLVKSILMDHFGRNPLPYHRAFLEQKAREQAEREAEEQES